MSLQSHSLVLSLIFLFLISPVQSGTGLRFLQLPQTGTQQDEKQKQQSPPPNQTTGQGSGQTDPKKSTDILKQYPHVPPPPPIDEIKKGEQEPPNRNKQNIGQKFPSGSEATIDADSLRKEGDLIIAEGYVNVKFGTYRLQADRVTVNETTNQITATGNVVFDADITARVTADRQK